MARVYEQWERPEWDNGSGYLEAPAPNLEDLGIDPASCTNNIDHPASQEQPARSQDRTRKSKLFKRVY